MPSSKRPDNTNSKKSSGDLLAAFTDPLHEAFTKEEVALSQHHGLDINARSHFC